MLLLLLLLLLLLPVCLICWVSVAEACLQCDRRIKLQHEDFINSAPSVIDQLALTDIFDQAYVKFRETSQERQGVIDPTTMYRARTEYYSEFDRFRKTPHTEESLPIETTQIVEKGNSILQKHLDTFIRDGLCPNKCGLLNQRVMDCSSCLYKIHSCPSPTGQQDCGEHPVQAEEGGQAVLDCFLPWHSLLVGRPEYHFSWAPGVPGTKELDESDFKGLIVMADPSVVLNQLRADEQGTYRCSLEDRKGIVFYRVTYPLTVTSLPARTLLPIPTLPFLPGGDIYSPFPSTEGVLVPVIAMVTTLSLAGSVGLVIVLGMMMKRRKVALKLRKKTSSVVLERGSDQ